MAFFVLADKIEMLLDPQDVNRVLSAVLDV